MDPSAKCALNNWPSLEAIFSFCELPNASHQREVARGRRYTYSYPYEEGKGLVTQALKGSS